MKFQKLTIHNIASIEDATIDFEAQPLADSEVFLITGTTGSGKSTILDAICLALFANTPRLVGTQMQGETKDGNTDVTIKDPRQLMRRNTGEAYVTLTFTGSNGVHYEATWSVARAYKKPTGTLQGKTWRLKNIDTNYPIEKDDAGIKAEIKAAIGLDFNQFCRTTMLAQGEFTRFLNSKDDDKAEILEKITGVDIYTKLGSKIYEVTDQKEKLWKDASAKVNDTQTLKEEEIAQKKEELSDLETKYNSVKAAGEADKTKLGWIKTNEKLEKDVATTTEEHRQAKAVVDSDDFKGKEMIVKQWNSTIDARNWLAAKKIAENSKTLQQNNLSALESDYVNVLSGLAYAEQEKKETETSIKTITSLIEGEKDKATVYDNAQTIIGHLAAIADGRNKIEMGKLNIGKENKSLAEELQPAFDKAQKEANDAQMAFNAQEAELKKQEKALEELHLSDLRKQHEHVKELLQHIATAFERMETHAKEKERMSNVAKELEKAKAEIEKKQNQSAAMEPQIRDAKVRMETCKEMLDKQSDTINKFAQTMRQKLHVGDKCPVCGQEIASELPHEEELAQLFNNLTASFKEAEKDYNALVEEKNELDAYIKSSTKSYLSSKDTYDRDKSVEIAAKKVVDACKVCGIETVDEETPTALKALNEKTENTRKELENKIAEGEEKEKAISDQRKAIETLRQNLEQLKGNALKTQQAINDCKSRIAIAEELVKTKKEEIAKAEESAASFITGQWVIDWKANPKDFSIELKNMAAAYQKNVQKKQTLDAQLTKMTDDCQKVKEVVDEIQQSMPSWKKLTASSIVLLPDLLKRANDVKAKIATALVQITQAEETININSQQLEEFLGCHKDITTERLTYLNGYTSQNITNINTNLEEGRNNVLTKKTRMDDAVRALEEHKGTKPELKEDETIEVLEARIKGIDDSLTDILKQKVVINNELEADKVKKEQLGQLKKDADKMEADYKKWSRLNQLVGDKTGKKFRTIAQSYVLSSLIHSANSYMNTLTDRYTLKVVPGTFVITIEDAYQGFASRAASTISGGESFLVSLSLALALSDIGQQLAVDTLFIDEGFGTLSGEPLQNAINTLRSLHTKAGRHVGIISHVEELKAKIPVQIQVEQEGNNSSSTIKIVPEE